MSIIKLKVVKRIEETSEAVSLYFKKPFFTSIKYKSGQFLTLIFTIGEKEYRRAYSLNSAPGIDKLLSVTIKKVEGGVVSNHIFNTVKVGDVIEVMKPMGGFFLMPKTVSQRHVVLWGGGSGITPLISIAKTVLYKEPKSFVSLIYSNKDEDAIIFKEELNVLANIMGNRLKITHFLTQPKYSYFGQKGLLTTERIVELMVRIANSIPMKVEHYICGPSGLMDVIVEGVKFGGAVEEQIFKESFTGEPGASNPASQNLNFEDRTIKLILARQEHGLRVPANTTILDAALQNKLKIPFSCGSGSCGTCMCEVKNGEVKMVGKSCLSEKDIKRGYVLACMSYPVTDEVVLKVV